MSAMSTAVVGNNSSYTISTIDPALFQRFQRLIYGEAGIWLSAAKTALLCGRLSRRVRATGVSTLLQYFNLVTAPAGRDELVLMIDAITTNETHFFREPRHFSFLKDELIPFWKEEARQGHRARRLRIWSAGCSTGEEPYSLAMLLADHLADWHCDILATDISTKVLAEAKRAVYKMQRAQEIPPDLLRVHMLRGVNEHEGHIKVAPAIQNMVTFRRVNLTEAPYQLGDKFDVIFCRNVLIYFDTNSKRQAVEAMIDQLHPTGLLFLGHAENLNGVTRRMRTVAPTIYTRCS